VRQRLDVAIRRLAQVHMAYTELGSGLLGKIPTGQRTAWRVCAQQPKAGVRAKALILFVGRKC